jgi:RHS repeat-associated protein
MLYDAVGRVTGINHYNGSGTALVTFTYSWDTASRLTSEVDNGAPQTYSYDSANQETADGLHTYSYDATGNRNNGSWTVGTGNQLTSDGTWNYSYDAEGNLTKKSKGASAETWTYGYDNQNELVWAEDRATDGGTLLARTDYKYDPYGSRLQKAVDSNGDGVVDTTERYALDGWDPAKPAAVGTENWDVWADLDGSSSLTTRYVHGDAVDQLFARIGSTGTAAWILTDHLGSVVGVTDGSGVLKDKLAYDGFGNITSESDATWGGHYKWTGRQLDTETQLQYNRRRYYDPATARWISQDPLGFDAGDSNLYRYVRNSPTTATDPNGQVLIALWGDAAKNVVSQFKRFKPSVDLTCEELTGIQVYSSPYKSDRDRTLVTPWRITLVPGKDNADHLKTIWETYKGKEKSNELYAALIGDEPLMILNKPANFYIPISRSGPDKATNDYWMYEAGWNRLIDSSVWRQQTSAWYPVMQRAGVEPAGPAGDQAGSMAVQPQPGGGPAQAGTASNKFTLKNKTPWKREVDLPPLPLGFLGTAKGKGKYQLEISYLQDLETGKEKAVVAGTGSNTYSLTWGPSYDTADIARLTGKELPFDVELFLGAKVTAGAKFTIQMEGEKGKVTGTVTATFNVNVDAGGKLKAKVAGWEIPEISAGAYVDVGIKASVGYSFDFTTQELEISSVKIIEGYAKAGIKTAIPIPVFGDVELNFELFSKKWP